MIALQQKTARLMIETVYCTLSLVAIVLSLGYAKGRFYSEFYLWYTNLSNYACMILMGITLVQTGKDPAAKPHKRIAQLRFLCTIGILITFVVYHLLLTEGQTLQSYFLSMENLLMHLILPLLFLFHWIFCAPHGCLHWYHPLLCAVAPLLYVGFILIRAAWLPQASLRYPYFFLNLEDLGVWKFLGWIFGLLLVFVAVGYLFYLTDRELSRRFPTKNESK